jgi:hypothetical protein
MVACMYCTAGNFEPFDSDPKIVKITCVFDISTPPNFHKVKDSGRFNITPSAFWQNLRPYYNHIIRPLADNGVKLR